MINCVFSCILGTTDYLSLFMVVVLIQLSKEGFFVPFLHKFKIAFFPCTVVLITNHQCCPGEGVGSRVPPALHMDSSASSFHILGRSFTQRT